jgi:hypothetical protein
MNIVFQRSFRDDNINGVLFAYTAYMPLVYGHQLFLLERRALSHILPKRI